MLHKPPGVISTTHAPQGRPTVRDLVPVPERVYPIGRLDADSEGLLLLTDDGDLTYRLTHPRFGHEQENWVLVEGDPFPATLRHLRDGVILDDGLTAPCQVERLSPQEVRALDWPPGTTWLRFILWEGHKRQVQRMCQAVGHPVRRLIRVRMGPLHLGRLPAGTCRHLTRDEVRRLKETMRKK